MSHSELLRQQPIDQCARCGVDNPPWRSFGVGGPRSKLTYCLHHIPLRYRIKVWWQEVRRA